MEDNLDDRKWQQVIEEIMLKGGLSINQLSEKTSLSVREISRIRKGVVHPNADSRRILEELAAEQGVKTDESVEELIAAIESRLPLLPRDKLLAIYGLVLNWALENRKR